MFRKELWLNRTGVGIYYHTSKNCCRNKKQNGPFRSNNLRFFASSSISIIRFRQILSGFRIYSIMFFIHDNNFGNMLTYIWNYCSFSCCFSIFSVIIVKDQYQLPPATTGGAGVRGWWPQCAQCKSFLWFSGGLVRRWNHSDGLFSLQILSQRWPDFAGII